MNLRLSARAMLCPRLVLPTPGGPTKHRIGSLRPSRPVLATPASGSSPPSARSAAARSAFILRTARYSRMRSLIFSRS